ncbi:hypothetical protein NIES593_20050 [Hydrococcus rivularis NIES-593]|jgi:hypothetical protein|uniref:Uncharacterized protein n=1 Tax=Hydrococcus rivularis NIES-593 TaxID=1921803 RepID=A0A1U7H906_9CYAN|nr:hypothetical protein [Hydrococcus rivularis]OKH20077.1 hypothetical protein NIES593_20050 [Hydrococcus rivularis NIES-593]
MTQPYENSLEKSKDIRQKVTSKIWAFATGMLAICIPLSAATDSGPIIPIAVVAGAAVGTASVWKSSDKKSANSLEVSNKIKELEGRIADLETIITAGEIDWQQRIQPTAKSDFPVQKILEERKSQVLPESSH